MRQVGAEFINVPIFTSLKHPFGAVFWNVLSFTSMLSSRLHETVLKLRNSLRRYNIVTYIIYSVTVDGIWFSECIF